MAARDPAAFSTAKSGRGIENPEDVAHYNVTQGGKRTALIIRWDGGEYDGEACWIRGSIDDLIDLDTIL